MPKPKRPSLGRFAVFILTNGRPGKVYTYSTLRKAGYTGKIFLLVDDLDKKRDEYIAKYGDEVVVFDKKAIAATFDQGDNFQDMRAIIYARNAAFEEAKKLGVKHFIELDDDYTTFEFRFDRNLEYTYRKGNCGGVSKRVTDLDSVFAAMAEFLAWTPVASIAMAQGGDFIGGEENPKAQRLMLWRKCMNSFVCYTDKPFQFVGRVNEDVNTYTHLASRGLLLFTTNQVSLVQKTTQSNSGGMTEMYLDSGTYVKSFYSVMYQPSSVKISILRDTNARIHHFVDWKNTTPMILREYFKER